MTTESSATPLDLLRQRWGFGAFRPGQIEAIEAVCGGRDALAVLPTGGGKSLVYQIPALLRPGVALIVSPLIALMRDQVDALAARGVRAAMAHGGLSRRDQEQLWTDAEFGRYDFVYLTPERLQTELFQARAPRLSVSLLAIDEAHCISEWGHDFRPAYRRIADARGLLSDASGATAPIVAVTATATPEVRRDIVAQLQLQDPEIVVRGFDRPNLVWSVMHTENKVKTVADVFEGVQGPGLVYAGTRRATEEWARRLSASGVGAEAYHAGLAPEARTAVQRRWLAGETRVIAATSAFGMGIDKADVRAVVHTALSPTLESYYQEAGRAGRDGERAYCVLVVGSRDEALPRAMAANSHPSVDQVQAVYRAAGSLAGLAIGSAPEEPTRIDPARLAALADVPEPLARAAVQHLAQQGVWSSRDARPDRVRIRVHQPPSALLTYAQAQRAPLATFVTAIVRALPPEAFGDGADVRMEVLTAATDLTEARVLRGLAFLAERQILSTTRGEGIDLEWSAPRAQAAPVDAAALARGQRRATLGLDHVLRYVESVGCRRQFLLAYFGEAAPSRCGRCDVCLGRHRPATITPEDEDDLIVILRAVERGEPRAAWLPGTSPRRRNALADWLLAGGLLDLSEPLADVYALTAKGLKAIHRPG